MPAPKKPTPLPVKPTQLNQMAATLDLVLSQLQRLEGKLQQSKAYARPPLPFRYVIRRLSGYQQPTTALTYYTGREDSDGCPVLCRDLADARHYDDGREAEIDAVDLTSAENSDEWRYIVFTVPAGVHEYADDEDEDDEDDAADNGTDDVDGDHDEDADEEDEEHNDNAWVIIIRGKLRTQYMGSVLYYGGTNPKTGKEIWRQSVHNAKQYDTSQAADDAGRLLRGLPLYHRPVTIAQP